MIRIRRDALLPLVRRRTWIDAERQCLRLLFATSGRPAVHHVFNTISRLSDGPIWYATVALLPWIAGPRGSACMWRMLVLGFVNVLLYAIVKRWFARPRPFRACDEIRACARVLDEYSFPSGHAVHAVAFGLVLSTYWPVLGWIVWPFALLVGLSRVVLGLHYPSDVLAGALIGWATAEAVLALM